MHILVHEVQNGEPQGGKGGQRQQWRQVLQEDLEPTSQQLLAKGSRGTFCSCLRSREKLAHLVSIQSGYSEVQNPAESLGCLYSRSSEHLHFIFEPQEKTWLLSVGKGRDGARRWGQSGEQYL